MIPYFKIPEIPLFGSVAIQPFGLLVATGILLGNWYAHRLGRKHQVPTEHIDGAVMWSVGMGFIISHIYEVFFYHPEWLVQDGPLVLLKIWNGISSFGGFLGAAIGLLIFFRRMGGKTPPLLICDIIIRSLVIGWIFGRLGCTIAHDHPGRLTDFPLAFNYPQGARHNLGFYEFLYTLLILTPAMLLAPRWIKNRPPGFYVAYLSLLYAPVRFFLDFLRSTDEAGSDIRFMDLTAAQYSCIALVIYCGWLLRRIYSKKAR